MINRCCNARFPLLCTLALGFCADAQAVDWSASAFGTLGGAISDNETVYQRYIDDSGTLMRDSLAGFQVDAKFNSHWSATSQVVLAPATDEDDVVKPQLKWTLLSYRPTDDWLLRAGRLSLGGLLYQQSLDVGVTYDMARLPNEVYLLSSAYDFDGLSVVKTWTTQDYEITLDATVGFQKRDYRSYGNGSEQALYYSGDVTGTGLILTVSDYDQTTLRAGWSYNQVESDNEEGFLTKYTYIPLSPFSYTLGRPEYEESVSFNTFFLGTRFPLGSFTVLAEATAVLADNLDTAPNTYAAYINLSRKLGNWTPYLTYARIWSDGLDTWRKVSGATPVPFLGVTDVKIEDAASSLAVYEQQSWMVGASYSITPKQKIKTEAMLTHVGERSAMFDGDLTHENVMVYSLSYNFSF